MGGVFCTYRALFSPKEVGRNKTVTGLFVSVPFTRYSHWVGDIDKHTRRHYHRDSAVQAEAFINAMRNPEKDVTGQLDTAAQRQFEENRQILVSIINSVLFLARCGVALRGHREGGRLQYVDSCHDVTSNEGNLRALLQFKAASGNEILKRHLQSAAENALYVSHESQCDLIASIGFAILRSIVAEVNRTRFFFSAGRRND